MSVKINIPPYWFPGNEQKRPIIINCKTAGECLKKLIRIYPEIEGKLFGVIGGRGLNSELG